MKKIAIVLSGGGARGAYEAGVLSYIYTSLPKGRSTPPRVDILCGTSIGAVHAAFVASMLDAPRHGAEKLADLWSNLRIEDVFTFGVRELLGLSRVVAGGAVDPVGLVDARPARRLLARHLDEDALDRNFEAHRLEALTLAATDIATGQGALFTQTAQGIDLPREPLARADFVQTRIELAHVLASSAIPLVFPPVRIDHGLYMDGGIRLNTPIAPALRFGATHVLAVSTTPATARTAPHEEHQPGATSVAGQILNVCLSQQIDADIELLRKINAAASQGAMAGAENDPQGRKTYRQVRCLDFRPSRDPSALAAEVLGRGHLRAGWLVRALFEALRFGDANYADLASYLLFDGRYGRELLSMGYADAEARHDELEDFFFGP